MDLSRRASPVPPLAESRRSSDFFRPVTTAGYSAAVPVVMGQQRVPTTIIRDGRKTVDPDTGELDNLICYGLCEGPITSIRRMYSDQGQMTDMGAAPDHLVHYGAVERIPWVQLELADSEATAPSRSFEVSSDVTLAGAQATWVPGTQGDDTGLDSGTGAPLRCGDFDVCTTGVGDAARQILVVWSASERTMELLSRTIGGEWSSVTILASDSIRSSLMPPATNAALPQPRVAAAGNLIHVVWNRNTIVSGLPSSDTLASGQIVHLWSADAGETWTVGEPLSLPVKLGFGVKRLGLALHSSGEVWAWAQRQNGAAGPGEYADAEAGPVVGFLPATATASTAWIVPTSVTSGGMTGAAGQMCVIDSGGLVRYDRYIVRAPSILPLGGGSALMAFVWAGDSDLSEAQLRVARIRATTVVRWDLPDDPVFSSNVASLVALNAAGFGERVMGYKIGAAIPWDSQVDYAMSSTQIVRVGEGWAVLANNAPRAAPALGSLSHQPPYADDEAPWGAWRIWWGTGGESGAVTWSGSTDLSTSSDPAFAARIFANGNGQIWCALGKPAAVAGGFASVSAVPEVRLLKIDTTTRAVVQALDYAGSTSLNNSVARKVLPLNGTALLLARENEDGDSHVTCGVREISTSEDTGDLLPSVIVRRLLKDPRGTRGLNLRHLEFDEETWGIFDNYCRVMGIRFSLLLTAQEAAWPLALRMIESANAYPYRSEGRLKVFVRETASITSDGVTYTPKPEHAGPCVVVPAGDLRDGLRIQPQGIDERWNKLTVSWRDRAKNYSSGSHTIVYESGRDRLGEIAASACDWPWITEARVVTTCTWLMLRRKLRSSRLYTFALPQRYMLLEVGDIITVSDVGIPARPVRLLKRTESAGGWIECEAEDVEVASRAVSPPPSVGSSTSGGTVAVATPVNLPILFVALIGGILQVWALLSGPAGWRGCRVQQSWDGTAWETIGACSTPSPTGWLVQDMAVLRARPGQRPHPNLHPRVADFALADFSEGTALPPFPTWSAFQAGDPGALLWVDGELMAYATSVDDGRTGQCSVLRRALYGTSLRAPLVGARVGAVTDAAFRWPVPDGRTGVCRFRFPSVGEDPSAVPTYQLEIPA